MIQLVDYLKCIQLYLTLYRELQNIICDNEHHIHT